MSLSERQNTKVLQSSSLLTARATSLASSIKEYIDESILAWRIEMGYRRGLPSHYQDSTTVQQ